MKKAKKVLLCIAIVAALACLLCACKSKKPSGGSDAGNNAPPEKNVIFSSSVDVTLIYPKDTGLSLDSVVTQIFDLTNKHTTSYGDDFAKTTAEIVFGDTTRDISKKAKEKLSEKLERAKEDAEELDESSKYMSGILFYAEGDSLAVVWADDSLFDYAVEYLLKQYVCSSELSLDSGYTHFVKLDLVEVIAEKEAVEREALYADVREKYGAEVEAAIRTHLGMFGERYYMWLADLYDPGEYDEDGNPLGGGFYFSNSGRDTPGYGVDLESTAQVLAFLRNSGMLDSDDMTKYFPERLQEQMVAFALSCQSPVDGYFYHPQWGTDIKDSRRSRDCGWAVRILNYFGEKPYWNTPAGAEGQNGDPPGAEPETALSGRLSDNGVSAVSKVLSVAGAKKWTGSKQLATVDAWRAYLDDLFKEIRTKSYSIGNTVASQSGQIENREKIAKDNGEQTGYIALFEEYFNKYQLSNGLWEECSVEDGTVYYNAINGLMKISGGYNSLGVKMNYTEEAIRAAAFMVTHIGSSRDGSDWKDSKGKVPSGSVDVYNPWVSINNIFENVKKYGDGEDAAKALRDSVVKPNALEMVKVTTRKIAMFARDDGSYCYNWGPAGATSQGAPVAVGGVMEGDVNGGNIAFTGTYREMANALGIKVKPFGYSDFLKFVGRLEELDSVIKDDVVVDIDAGRFDFEDDVIGSNAPTDVTLSMNTGSVEVVKDNITGSNVVKFSTLNGAGSSMTFKPATVKSAQAAIFEWDVRFDKPEKKQNTVFQIRIGDYYMLTLSLDAAGVLTVGDASSTGTGISTAFDIKLNGLEWNSFRVEHYILDSETRSNMAKIYINGALRFTSTNYFGKEAQSVPAYKYTYARFYALATPEFTCYFDNVKAYQSADFYKEEAIVNPDRVKDFETIPEGSDMPAGVESTGGAIVKDGDNSYLVLDGTGKSASVAATTEGATANCYCLNTKIKIDGSTLGTVAKLFLAKADKAKAIVAYEIVVYEEEGEKRAKLVEFDKTGKKGNEFKELPIGEWFDLTVEFYPYFYESEESSIIRVNGAEIGRGTLHYYIGTVSGPYSKMIVETLLDVKISLDNVIPEFIEKDFKDKGGESVSTPEITLPESGASSYVSPADDHDGRFDFEDQELGTPKLAGLRTTVNADEYENRIVIAEDPTDAANKVIKHTAVKGGSGNTTFFTASYLSPADANCYVYSFDIYIDGFTSGGIQNSIKGKIGDKEVNMFQTNISVNGKHGVADFTLKTKRDSESDLAVGEEINNSNVIVDTVEFDGWVNVRFELYTDEGIVKIFYDDQLRAETDVVYSGRMSASLSRCSMFTTSGTNATIYYDNVVCEAVNKAYEKGTPIASGTPAGDGSGIGEVTPPEDTFDGVFDFEKYENGTASIEKLTGSFGEGYMMITEDPRDAAGKVLEYSTKKGKNEVLTFTPGKSSNAQTLILAFDMLLVSYETESLMQIKLDSSYMISMQVKNDIITVSDYSSSDGKVTTRRTQTLISDIDATKWHSYKIEYAIVDGMALAKIYVDEVLRAVSGNYYDQKDTIGEPSFTYTKATMSSLSAAIFKMNLDNVVARMSDIAIEKADYTHFAHILGSKFTYTPITEAKDFEDGSIKDGIINSQTVGDADHIAVSIVDDPIHTDVGTAASKVLKFSVGKDATCSNSDAVHTRLTPANLTKATDESGNYVEGIGTYVFSYDVRFDNLSAVSGDIAITDMIFDHAPSSNRKYAYWNFMQLILTKNGDFNLKIANNGTTPNVGVVCKGLQLGDGNWHNIRLAVEKAGADSRISVFVDDVCVIYRVNCYYDAVDIDTNTYINDVFFRQRKTTVDYDVYYDNFLFEFAADYDVLSGYVK